jgi:NhaP-type Na+/H+ or K+/H+ antiporter
LLYEITKQHRYGLFFLYGSAISVINLVTGMLPQAIIVCLILLLVARPKWFWGILIIAGLTHFYGIIFIGMARIWLWFKETRLQKEMTLSGLDSIPAL